MTSTEVSDYPTCGLILGEVTLLREDESGQHLLNTPSFRPSPKNSESQTPLFHAGDSLPSRVEDPRHSNPTSNLRGPQVHLPATLCLLPAPSPRLPAFRPKSRSSSRPRAHHLDAQLYGTFPAVMAPVPGPALVLVRPNDVTPTDPTNRDPGPGLCE